MVGESTRRERERERERDEERKKGRGLESCLPAGFKYNTHRLLDKAQFCQKELWILL
jgi:hypothetical protein